MGQMISSLKFLFIGLLLTTSVINAGVDLTPRSGISLNAELGKVSQGSIVLKPDASQISAVRYRLHSLQLNDYKINPNRLKVKTLYTIGAESLDLYRTFLSGNENANQVNADFEFEPEWSDAPGVYMGSLVSTNDVPTIPVKITIVPKTVVSLQPAIFSINSSLVNAPIAHEVSVLLGSNSPHWELYLNTDHFIQEATDEKINADRIFVRIKDEINPRPWLALDKMLKIISGVATPITTITILEFLVSSERADRAGEYLGNIKFLVRNIN